ncbi:MAG: hypothetical protein Q4D60_06060 [Eubacteriales bacterium]|nr:hypothetical protein [Eubacteriales bacterium]
MHKLIKAELKRYFISPYYLGTIFILMVLQTRRSTGWIPILSNLIFWGDQFMYNNSILAILLSLFIFAYVYEAYFTRILHMKLILGYTKSQIFIAETVSCGICSGILVAIGNAIYVIRHLYNKEPLELSMSSILINTIIFMSSLSCIAVMICSLSLILKKHIFTALILVCTTVCMLQLGTKDISLLTFSESTLVIQEENETDEGKFFIANNLRVNDTVRSLLNFRVMISPYAQCNYSAYLTTERQEEKPNLSFLLKENPYHIDFLLSNIMLSTFVICIGSNIFKRQDI